MPSPFPGMDPYLESHWRDVHASLVIYTRDALQAVLPGALRARVEERVLLETASGLADHTWIPDDRNGAYDGTLNYTADPTPPFEGADKKWVDQLLTKAGYRKKKKSPRRKGKSV